MSVYAEILKYDFSILYSALVLLTTLFKSALTVESMVSEILEGYHSNESY